MSIVQGFIENWLSAGRRLPPASWVLAGVAGLACFLGLFLWGIGANSPAYMTLFSDLTEEDVLEIAGILEQEGVPYQLTGDGTTLQVPKDEVYKTRLQVAQRGLPRAGTVGFELFDRGGLERLGMSAFTQRINYQRALEGELSRTIREMAGVRQARVHLVLPEKTLFTQNQPQPTASVMLSLQPGYVLSEDQVWGIGYLVAGSVEGLLPENVTIVDVAGRVLAGDGTREGGSSRVYLSMAQLRAEREVEQDLEQRLQNMLDQAIGAGRSVVRVNVDLDWNQVEMTSERFAPDAEAPAGVIRSLHQTLDVVEPAAPAAPVELLRATTDAMAGVVDPEAGGVVRQEATVDYEISKTVKRTVQAPGDIRRLSVAVLLDSHDQQIAAQQPAIEQMIRAAIGYDPARGDVVTIDMLPFDKPAPVLSVQPLPASPMRFSWPQAVAALSLVTLFPLGVYWVFRGRFPSRQQPLPGTMNPELRQLQDGPSPGPAMAGYPGMMGEAQSPLYRWATAVAEMQPETVAEMIQQWLDERS